MDHGGRVVGWRGGACQDGLRWDGSLRFLVISGSEHFSSFFCLRLGRDEGLDGCTHGLQGGCWAVVVQVKGRQDLKSVVEPLGLQHSTHAQRLRSVRGWWLSPFFSFYIAAGNIESNKASAHTHTTHAPIRRRTFDVGPRV